MYLVSNIPKVKKPDKKVYTITKKGMELMKDNLLSDASSYIRSGNFGDQIKSEFFFTIIIFKIFTKRNNEYCFK